MSTSTLLYVLLAVGYLLYYLANIIYDLYYNKTRIATDEDSYEVISLEKLSSGESYIQSVNIDDVENITPPNSYHDIPMEMEDNQDVLIRKKFEDEAALEANENKSIIEDNPNEIDVSSSEETFDQDPDQEPVKIPVKSISGINVMDFVNQSETIVQLVDISKDGYKSYKIAN